MHIEKSCNATPEVLRKTTGAMSCIAVYLLFSSTLFGQKRPIDSSVYDKWPSVESAHISPDGKYVHYDIINQPVGSRSLVVQSTDAGWKVVIPGVNNGFTAAFTADSKKLVFMQPNDSLGIAELGSSAIQYIPAASFKVLPNGTGDWLVYKPISSANGLVVQNLKTGATRSFSSVNDYMFDRSGEKLILQVAATTGNAVSQALKMLTLSNGDLKTIWQGKNPRDVTLGNNQLAFIADNMEGQPQVWYYESPMPQALLLAGKQSAGMEADFHIEAINHFSADGKALFLEIKQTHPKLPVEDDSAGTVRIWSYLDTKLPSQQPGVLDDQAYLAVLNIQDKRIVRLEQEYDNCFKTNDNFAYVYHVNGDGGRGEENWNPAHHGTLYVINVKNGSRKQIKEIGNRRPSAKNISPSGKYFVFYNDKLQEFFSYEFSSGALRNITKGLGTSWLNRYGNDYPISSHNARGIAGWVDGDGTEAVLIYDTYDLWKIDPAGKSTPRHLTNGYGTKHHIIFSLPGEFAEHVFKANDSVIVTAFNTNNKENGFYRISLNQETNPELLTMGPFLYDIPGNRYIPQGSSFDPIKATHAEKYLVRRMSAGESPNFFSTADFKTFTPLSDVHPEKEYNWYTTTLYSWKTEDGDTSQGILYKPENFDPHKKYPVVFLYYEIKSDGLNAYLKPENLVGTCLMDIPTYVSNGYLVFTPDIHFTIGKVGESAVKYVASAARFVSTMPFVNGQKMGIHGCSFGGYLTNYLATHTNIFAAAVSASGISNFISGYGSLAGDGSVLQAMYERTYFRMGKTLWQKPDWYIENSPVLAADKITTPILMMHTTHDEVCPFPQAIELFTAFRRLGKKAWLLEYSEGNHGVFGKSAEDFSTRMSQFFDYYLRDKPAPKWMTQ